MTSPAYARGDDRLPMLAAPADPEPLLHRWRNADRDTRGIAEVSCTVHDGGLWVRVVAAGPDGPIDWGAVPAAVHADLTVTGGGRALAEPVMDELRTRHYADVSATDSGPAFAASFDHGFQRVLVQARINLGLLVVAFFTEFLDGSGRANYYHREVFVRDGVAV
ncbi:MAG TPA: hypothetical protein VJT31_20850 [Rugosimonospora sp.]|nr:hypothetical protein [Rugosimonospora sp.]